MIRRLVRWLFERPRAPSDRVTQPGSETRRCLELGMSHRRAALETTNLDRRIAENRCAAYSFKEAATRRPDMVEALEERATSLSDVALCRIQQGAESPEEWLSAVRLYSRVTMLDPRRSGAYARRAILYLASALYLISKGDAASEGLNEARRDLAQAVSLNPSDRLAGALRELYACILATREDPSTVEPLFAELRRLGASL